MPGISAQEITRRGRLLETGQTTCYHVGDDGDIEAGLDKAYQVYTVGSYAGTSDIEVAHYAAATISFTAPNTVSDAAAGLATILTGDVVVIKGAANPANNGVFNVAAGGVAGAFTTVENTIVNELAGAVISLYKRTAHSNNCVFDRRTGQKWSRYTSNGEKVGAASNGTLVWYDAALVFPLHPAAADLSIVMPGNILRIVGGAAEIDCYHEGDLLDCAGFANAVNNLPGYYVISMAVNGADLDIVLDPCQNTLIAEAAGGARSIGLVCRSIFNYAAGARRAILAGYDDWRQPCDTELASLRNMEAASALPDAVAFPGWPVAFVWASGSRPDAPAANAMNVAFGAGSTQFAAKTTAYICILVRG